MENNHIGQAHLLKPSETQVQTNQTQLAKEQVREVRVEVKAIEVATLTIRNTQRAHGKWEQNQK